MRYGIDIPDNPRTIQEKLIWLQFYDPMNYLKPLCADKLKVHEYCKEKLGKDICVPVLKVFDKPEDFNLNEMPEKFILKSNHASGQIIICRNKNEIDVQHIVESMKKWISKPYGLQFFEPHYFYIDRKCYAEKLLTSDDKGSSLVDYRLWMFNGKLGLISVNSGFGHGPITRFNSDFVLVEEWNEPNRIEFKRPDCFDTMKEYAERLSAPFKFVRVDFYEVDGNVYLGEMTFTPGACLFSFKKQETSIEFGDMLKL